MANLNIAVITPDDVAVASYTEGYTFTVKNNETFPIVFKIFTQRPDLYTFTPAFALVLGSGSVDVTIRLKVPTFYIAKLSGNADIALHTATSSEEKSNTDEATERRRRKKARRKEKREYLRRLAKENNEENVENEDGDTATEGDSSTDYSEDYTSDDVGAHNADDTEKTTSSERQKSRRKKARLDRISTYLKTQISSGVFKVEIRVTNTPIGSGVAETVYLSRQHSLEYIAKKDLERKHNKKNNEPPSTNSSASKRLSTNVSGDNLAQSSSGGGHYRPTGDELQIAITTIKNNAYSLFDHIWKHAIPHSTHTICCRTLREDLSTFFSKINDFQQKDIARLNDEHQKLEKEVETLQKEVGELRRKTEGNQRQGRFVEAGVPARLFINTKEGGENENFLENPEILEIIEMLNIAEPTGSNPSSHSQQTRKQQFMIPLWLGVLAALAAFWMAYQTPTPLPLPPP